MKNRYLKKALAVMTGISLLAGGTAAIVPAEESTAYEAVSSETSADAVSGDAAATEAAAESTEAAATEAAAETTEAAAEATETTEAAAEATAETTEAAAEAAEDTEEAVETYAAETTDPADHEAVYQVALLQSLAQGYFDGTVSVGELKQFGDTGIGTFDGLDGEMIVLDGTVYRAAADGTVNAVEDDMTVPFANITFFEEDGSIAIENATDIQVLMGYLNEVVAANGKNLFYMVKVTGTFSDILVRSEPKQEKPYRLLDEALAADQVEYEYTDINGTLVGLFCPVYMKGLNSAGWHFHFVSDDLTKGGHVLQVNIASAQASYDITGNFRLFLPDNEDFQGINLGRDMDDVIKNAETQSNGNAGQAPAETSEGEAADAAAGTEAEDGNAEASAGTEGGNAEVTDAEAPAEGAEAADAEAPAEGTEPAGEPITYTVQEGDNLYSIASQFNITPEELFGLNRQNIIDNANANGYYYETDEEYMEWIFLGQELVVGEEAPKAAEAAEGEAPAEGTEAAAANAEADEQERNEGQSVKTEETAEEPTEAAEAEAGEAEAETEEAKAGDAEAETAEAGDAEAEAEAGDAEAETEDGAAGDAEAETTEATTEEAAVEGGNKLAEIQERGVLLVGATGDYRPMSYYDSVADMYVGFDTELAKDLAESLDVDIEFVPTTWPTLLQDTLDGKFDIAITGITITEERQEQALMSDGYLGNGKTVLCRAEDAGKYTSIDAINQADVRVMENPGGLNEKFAEENLPNAQLTIHETNEEIPGLIAEGEADVMITEIMEAGYYAGQDDRLAAPLIDEPFTQGELGALLPKDAGDLLQYVNAFFALEKNSGRIDELANTYIYMTAEEDEEAAA